MHVLVSGSTGLIGTEVCRQLEAAGHTVLRLVRREPLRPGEYQWNPAELSVDPGVIERADAVINLSGASLARLPWTPGYRRTILSSRVRATRTLTDAMKRASTRPQVLLNASAVGIYGNRPGQVLTESSSPDHDFLANVVASWEHEALRAPDGIRVVTFRSGLVLARGGALKPLIPLTTLGLAGPLGGGTQHWPWISLLDEAAAIVHLATSTLSGPVNLVGPEPATANDVMHTLADAMHRPYRLPVPRAAITLALQDAGRQLLLADQNVRPEKLLSDGFTFTHTTPAAAIDWMLSSS